MPNYPGSLDTTGAGTLPTNHADGISEVIHAASVNDHSTTIVALETKLGVTASTPTAGLFMMGNTTAGTSSWQDAGVGRTWESFGGTPGGSVAVQAAAMVLAQAWWVAMGGGTVIFGPNTYINLPQISFPVTGCGIRGDGMQSTTISPKASLNTDFIINHVSTNGTTDPNAQLCRVSHLQIDGNKSNQTSGGGIRFNTNPGVTQTTGTWPTGDLTFDSMFLIEHIWMTNVKGNGITTNGRSATYINHCDIYLCDGRGLDISFDTWIHALNVGLSGLQGIALGSPNVFATGCAMYYSGNVTPSSGAGWLFTNFHNNGSRLSSCGAQDNKAYGFQVSNSNLIQLSSCIADSNSTSSAGTYSALDMFGGAQCTIDLNCQDRKWNGVTATQLTAIQMRNASINNQIRLTHYPCASTVNAPVQQWSSDSTGNEVNIEGYGGYQNVAYAATITPDPTLGGTVIVGALTGAITINAVAAGNQWPGQILAFHLTQDATGGRVVTWNAAYHLAGGASPTTTLSKRNIVTFIWDATAAAYIEIGRSVAV